MIVADTNLIAYLLLEGENTAAAERVLNRDSRWIAPLLWRSELRKVLAPYLRQDLLTVQQAGRSIELAEIFMAGRNYTLASEVVLRLAASSGCSAYDCEFVALAQQREIPMVTSDRDVLRAFPDVAVHPTRFAAQGRGGRRCPTLPSLRPKKTLMAQKSQAKRQPGNPPSFAGCETGRPTSARRRASASSWATTRSTRGRPTRSRGCGSGCRGTP